MDDPSTTAVRWVILDVVMILNSSLRLFTRSHREQLRPYVQCGLKQNCWPENNKMGSLLLLRIAKLLLQHACLHALKLRVPAMDVHICKSLYYCIIASRDDT